MRPELRAWIDLARVDARRRRHDAVDVTHLFGVVLALTDVVAAFLARGLDATELREKLDAYFDASPAIGGYRDGTDVPLSAALERVVVRFDGTKWRPFGPRVTILDALLPEPAIARLVFELRRGNDYRYVLQRAGALAVMSGHAVIGVAHVFRVLLDLPSFVDAVGRAGGDAEALRADVDVTLASTRDADPDGVLESTSEVEEIVSAAKTTARRSGGEAPTIRQIGLELARNEVSARFWSAAGIDASAFVRALQAPAVDYRRAGGLLR